MKKIIKVILLVGCVSALLDESEEENQDSNEDRVEWVHVNSEDQRGNSDLKEQGDLEQYADECNLEAIIYERNIQRAL
jgi:hypothetical protein